MPFGISALEKTKCYNPHTKDGDTEEEQLSLPRAGKAAWRVRFHCALKGKQE